MIPLVTGSLFLTLLSQRRQLLQQARYLVFLSSLAQCQYLVVQGLLVLRVDSESGSRFRDGKVVMSVLQVDRRKQIVRRDQ